MPSVARNKKVYYRDEEVIKVLKISRRTLTRLVENQKLPGRIQLTGRVRIWDAEVVHNYLESKMMKHEPSNTISKTN